MKVATFLTAGTTSPCTERVPLQLAWFYQRRGKRGHIIYIVHICNRGAMSTPCMSWAISTGERDTV